MAMIASLTSTSVFEGILYMALFGLGTVPLMSAVVLLGNFTNRMNRQRIQKIIPVVVVVIGMFFVLRGLGLGIPYVSPKPMLVDFGKCNSELSLRLINQCINEVMKNIKPKKLKCERVK